MKYAETPAETPAETHCRSRSRQTALTLAAATLVLALALTAGCGDDATPGATEGPVGSTTGTTTVSPTSSTTAGADTGTIPTTPSGETMTTITYAPPYTGTTQAGVPLPPLESNALARELKRTSQAGAKLAGDMQTEGAAAGDPRSGTVYALRARAQAITARRAIVDGQLPLADEAVRQVGRLLAEAARTAAGDTATALAQTQEHMALMAFPSQATLQAASALDHVIRDLAPLVPEGTTPTS
ncbi:MAG: hypothetical protein ACYCX3_02695 [Thermoleophilia bacterium]